MMFRPTLPGSISVSLSDAWYSKFPAFPAFIENKSSINLCTNVHSDLPTGVLLVINLFTE